MLPAIAVQAITTSAITAHSPASDAARYSMCAVSSHAAGRQRLRKKWTGPKSAGRDVTDDGFRGAYWVDDDAAAPARGAATSAQDAASSDAMFVVSRS